MTSFYYQIHDCPWRKVSREQFIGYVGTIETDPIFAEEAGLRVATITERTAPSTAENAEC